MSALSQRDCRLALDAVADICSERRREHFARVVVVRLAELVPSDAVSVNLAGAAGTVAVDEPLGTCTPALRAELRRLLGERPMLCEALREGEARVFRLSDFYTPGHLKNVARRREFCATTGLLHEISLTVRAARDAWLAIGLNRRSPDYSDRELALLRLVAPHVIAAYRRLENADDRLAGMAAMPARLTPREHDVLAATRCGKTNAEIGAALGISGRTAQKHLENIFRKLDVHRRAAAAVAGVPVPDGR